MKSSLQKCPVKRVGRNRINKLLGKKEERKPITLLFSRSSRHLLTDAPSDKVLMEIDTDVFFTHDSDTI